MRIKVVIQKYPDMPMEEILTNMRNVFVEAVRATNATVDIRTEDCAQHSNKNVDLETFLLSTAQRCEAIRAANNACELVMYIALRHVGITDPADGGQVITRQMLVITLRNDSNNEWIMLSPLNGSNLPDRILQLIMNTYASVITKRGLDGQTATTIDQKVAQGVMLVAHNCITTALSRPPTATLH